VLKITSSPCDSMKTMSAAGQNSAGSADSEALSTFTDTRSVENVLSDSSVANGAGFDEDSSLMLFLIDSCLLKKRSTEDVSVEFKTV
jgi:hypothetical protein